MRSAFKHITNISFQILIYSSSHANQCSSYRMGNTAVCLQWNQIAFCIRKVTGVFFGVATLSREKRLLASRLCIRPSKYVYQMGSQFTDFRQVRDYYENPSKNRTSMLGTFRRDLRTTHVAGDLKSSKKAPTSSKTASRCKDSRGGINITWTRHNVTLLCTLPIWLR